MIRHHIAIVALSVAATNTHALDGFDTAVCEAISDQSERTVCELEMREGSLNREERSLLESLRRMQDKAKIESVPYKPVKRPRETRTLNVDYAAERGSFIVTYQLEGYDPGVQLNCVVYGRGKPGSHYASTLHKFATTANRLRDIQKVTVSGLKSKNDIITTRCYPPKK